MRRVVRRSLFTFYSRTEKTNQGGESIFITWCIYYLFSNDAGCCYRDFLT